MPHTIGINGVSRHIHSILQERFTNFVMCDFTPRRPNELPMAQWASYKELSRLFDKHADVRRLGPGNLKQLIIAWYKDDPAFAGLAVDTWCRKLTDKDPAVPPLSQVFKFCFEHTPGGSALPQVASRKRGRQWPNLLAL